MENFPSKIETIKGVSSHVNLLSSIMKFYLFYFAPVLYVDDNFNFVLYVDDNFYSVLYVDDNFYMLMIMCYMLMIISIL